MSEALFNSIIHQSSKHHKRRSKTALGTLALLVDVPKKTKQSPKLRTNMPTDFLIQSVIKFPKAIRPETEGLGVNINTNFRIRFPGLAHGYFVLPNFKRSGLKVDFVTTAEMIRTYSN
ncbi:hypothetical protein V8G54_011836 [Vigna mungo]|uniref:Uncharacterized protein n=1 Tax=Vigna mungo TaxID=3915 RepID=A0AAQ3NQV6_VIGMU